MHVSVYRCVNVAFIDLYSPSHLIGLDWCRADLIEDSNVPYPFTLRLVQLIAQLALVGIAFGGDQELLSAASPIRPVQSIRYSCDFEGKHLIVFRCTGATLADRPSPSHLIRLDWCHADLIEDSNVPYPFTLRLVQLIAQLALVGIAFGGDQELLSAASPIRPVQSIRYSCDFEGKHLIVFRCSGATLADRPSPSHLIRLDWCHADLIEDSNVPYPFTLRSVQWRAVRVSLVFPRSC